MVKKAVSIGNSQEIAAEITAVALKIERTAVGDSVDSSTMSDINIATKVSLGSWLVA